jgi:carotenoid cleavage dioxygenase-like enzyme
VMRYPQLTFMNPRQRETQFGRDEGARLHRWRIDLRGGTVHSTPLDDRTGEFPRIDERRLGRRHRFGYLAATGPEGPDGGLPVFTALHRYDLERGTCEVRAFGAGNGVSEPLFVPRNATAAEDDGYVIALAYDHERNASEFLVLDARHVASEPLARVRLPHRVPYGFHGNWVSA